MNRERRTPLFLLQLGLVLSVSSAGNAFIVHRAPVQSGRIGRQCAQIMQTSLRTSRISRKTGDDGNFHRFHALALENSIERRPHLRKHKIRSNALIGSSFPSDYNDIIRRASSAVNTMLQDDVRLIEVEFPVTGLAAVPGDGEGAGEMTLSAMYTKEIVAVLQRKPRNLRIFFPDEQEAKRQKRLFNNVQNVMIDFLTRPSALGDLGLDPFKVEMKDRIRDEDEIFIVAYPSFNPNEMIAVRELADQDDKDRPIVVINGELDRIRSGYYPAFFYPRLNSAMKGFLEDFDQALYIHNFKGSRGGALHRTYPGSYQVYVRDPLGLKVREVYSQQAMPSLKEVSLEILPKFT